MHRRHRRIQNNGPCFLSAEKELGPILNPVGASPSITLHVVVGGRYRYQAQGCPHTPPRVLTAQAWPDTEFTGFFSKPLTTQAKRLPYLADVQVGLEAWAHLDHFLEVSLGASQVVPVRHAPKPQLASLQVVQVGSDVDLPTESQLREDAPSQDPCLPYRRQ